jgi:hypothetical protein
MKSFLGLDRDRQHAAALDRRAAVENRARAIVVTASETQLKRCHTKFLSG